MKQDFDELIKYIRNLNDYTLPNFNDLPKIPLYMEQVTTYIGETLMPLFENNASTIITPYMVNNYVKAKIVIPPKEKKYDTNHIGYLIFRNVGSDENAECYWIGMSAGALVGNGLRAG